MTTISIICFVIFIALLVSLFKKNTDLFAPGRLFAMVWLFAIAITDLKFSHYQKEWSGYSWLMLLITLSGFLVGVFIVYSLNFNKSTEQVNVIRDKVLKLDINEKVLFNTTLILFFLYLLSFYATYLIRGYIPILSMAPDFSRSRWGVFGFGLLVQAVPSIVYFAVLYLFYVDKKTSKKIALVFIIVLTVFTYLTILQRFYLVLPLVFVMVLSYYGSYKFNKRNILIFLLVIGVIIFGISSIRASKWVANLLYYISDMKFSIKYAYLTEPYMYVAMNLENFANAVSKLTQFDYGWNTFDFILALTGMKHMLAENNYINEFPHLVMGSYNTYTMFFIYYKDFGILGLGFIPMLLGLLIGYLHHKIRAEATLQSISIYAFFVFLIMFSFFVPILHWLHFVFNLTLIGIITNIIVNKNYESVA